MQSTPDSKTYTGVGLQLFSLLVPDYDSAIEFYVSKLGFKLVEDKPALTNDGRTKRWVVIRPPENEHGCGLLLAKVDGPDQEDVLARSGGQFGGRVGLFWRVEDFDGTLERLRQREVLILGNVRHESYGRFVVFQDHLGNKWDLLGEVI